MTTHSYNVGDIVDVEVVKISNFGAFVKLPNNQRGLIHISQVADDFVNDINNHLKVGDKIKARIKKITVDGKIDLTLKNKDKDSAAEYQHKGFKGSTFEEKMEAFLKKSAQRQSDLQRNIEAKRRG